MRLSPNFTLDEFLVSETAARHGIEMTPPPEIRANLERLARELLQPLRDRLTTARGCDAPIFVTSGYRTPELNRLVGGSATSQHVAGEAADIRAVGFTPADLWVFIHDHCGDLPVDQCILEFGSWVHLSINPVDRPPRRQFLSAVRRDGRTVYLQGQHEA